MTHAAAARGRPTDDLFHPVPARRRRMLTVPVLVAGFALLAGGCGGTTGSDASPVTEGTSAHPSTITTTTIASSLPAKAFTVEQLAAVVGCEAKMTVKVADYRHASCATTGAEFVFLDFDTAAGQRAWLDAAEPYGGVYLVGDRWALSGMSKEYLETLRAKLGGTLEEHGAHGSHPGGS